VIDIHALKRIARMKGLTNMGHAEKDYFQEILLLGVSRESPGLVFKGGTALYKFHGLGRFSEDLDFSGRAGQRDLEKILSYLRDFGYESEVSSRNEARGKLLTFSVKGFLYRGTAQTLARIRMDVNPDSEVVLEPEYRMMYPLYPDLPPFGLRVMSLTEMAAEKMRALLIRAKARDAFDLWFMIGKGIAIDAGLLDRKLELYNMKAGAKLLDRALEKAQRSWNNELRPMVTAAPDYHSVEQTIRGAFQAIGRGEV